MCGHTKTRKPKPQQRNTEGNAGKKKKELLLLSSVVVLVFLKTHRNCATNGHLLTDKELSSFLFFLLFFFLTIIFSTLYCPCINCSITLGCLHQTSPHSQKLTTESPSLSLGWANKTCVSRKGLSAERVPLKYPDSSPGEVSLWTFVFILSCQGDFMGQLSRALNAHPNPTWAKASHLSPCSTCKGVTGSQVLCMLKWILQENSL